MDVAALESTAVVMRAAARAGSLAAIALTVHTAWNLRHLVTLRPVPVRRQITERISIVIPARDEANTIERTVKSALDQQGLENLEIIVLDDGSTDGTGPLLTSLHHSQLTVIHGENTSPPVGWLGKPHACARLSTHASGSVIVFLDADVTLDPYAVASAVQLLREGGYDLVAPYPRLIAEGWFERLIQPLVVWSWASTVPLSWAETSQRPSLSAANGQLLVFDSAKYRDVSGHNCVADNVLEDIGLMRAIRSAGGRAITVNGSHIADCRMYSSTTEVVDGYTKSLWAAFGGPAGTVAVVGFLSAAYVLPAAAMLTARTKQDRLWGLAGFVAGVAGRALVAQKTGGRVWPDVCAQPVSITAFAGLNALSWLRHLRGTNSWKGRAVTTADSP